MHVDVVIVGAGPAGLMLACELRLSGVSTIVLDGRAEPDGRLRAQGVTRPAAQALERHGLLAGLIAQVDGPGLLEPADRLPAVLPGIPQQLVERALEDHAIRLGADVRRRHEVVGVRQHRDHVTVDVRAPDRPDDILRVSGRYLVGCDGSRSTIRRCVGFATSGTPATVTGYQALVTVRAPQPPALPPGTHRTRTGMVTWRPGPCRVVSIEFTAPPDRDAPVTLDDVQASLRRTSGMELTLTAPLSVARFTDATKLADTYRMGRVLLAGDAAHVHPPNGGLGLNLALTDALNLGWKLAATVHGRAAPGLLDTYERERRPVAVKAIRNALADMVLIDPDERMTPAYELYTELKSSDVLRPPLFELITMSDWAYDLGAPPDRRHHLLGRAVGDLVIRNAGGTTRLAPLQGDGRGVLIDFAGRAADLHPLAARWAGRVDLLAAEGGDDLGVDALLVRPDGCVAWVAPRGGGPVPGELATALSAWFGPPVMARDVEGGAG
jgi:2-polyprenyl-6-methoxyphenol hydroxylase-like FAD-dependent oxidoreductase